MPLTRDFKETVQARAVRDPAFREELLKEGVECTRREDNSMQRCSYIFLDEAGNFDFSDKGTRYFTLASVSARRPFDWVSPLDEFKHDCIERGIGIEYFHCYNDSRRVRSSVFDLIESSSADLNVDYLVVDKSKVSPFLRDQSRFYPEMLGLLLSLVIPVEAESGETDEIIVITDTIPVNRRRRAVEKTVQTTLVRMLPPRTRYRLLHHQSRSHYGLQVADYCCWAVFRKWESKDGFWLDGIMSALRNEFEFEEVWNPE